LTKCPDRACPHKIADDTAHGMGGRGSISWGWFVMTGVILYLMVVL